MTPAKPCTPVRFRASPPAKRLEIQRFWRTLKATIRKNLQDKGGAPGGRIDPFPALFVLIAIPSLLGFAVLIGPFYLAGEIVSAARERR